eukprot:GHRQ01022780.1.p2 GENE.GHRQ01022780.1~~GHRQ01022780.1.p2  ORF type:complete len:168 (+),score=31.26 GHRQ01022780.1:123-626(+)
MPAILQPMFIALQILGAICGDLLVAGLVTGAYVGMGDGGPGCFDDNVLGKGLTHSQLFGWEVVMTFTLISVVYACGIAKPGHGSFTPLAVGLSLVACAGTGGSTTAVLGSSVCNRLVISCKTAELAACMQAQAGRCLHAKFSVQAKGSTAHDVCCTCCCCQCSKQQG